MSTETSHPTEESIVVLPSPARPTVPMTVEELVANVDLINDVMRRVMKKGHHFGKIPGTPKPTLLQPGAQVLLKTFRLSAMPPKVKHEYLRDDHRETTVSVTVQHESGYSASAVGSCSTLEKKYRYRWEGRGNNRTRIENPDIADQWNTVLKMAHKRALVAAVLLATAASDIFTQDIEDMDTAPAKPAPQPKTPDVPPPYHAAPERRTTTYHDVPPPPAPNMGEPTDAPTMTLTEQFQTIVANAPSATLEALDGLETGLRELWSRLTTETQQTYTQHKDAAKSAIAKRREALAEIAEADRLFKPEEPK